MNEGSSPKRAGVVVITVWSEPSVDRAPTDNVRARITATPDVVSGAGETWMVASSEAVLAVVERWLREWVSAN